MKDDISKFERFGRWTSGRIRPSDKQQEMTPEKLLEQACSGNFAAAKSCPPRDRYFWRDFANSAVTELKVLEELDFVANGLVHASLEIGLHESEIVVSTLCQALTKKGKLPIMQSLVGQLLNRYPQSTTGHLQLSRIHFRSGELEAAREELHVLLPIKRKQKWVAYELLQLAMSFSAWEILELAIPQCEELDEPELLGERILKAKILLSLPRHASRNDQVPVICINLDRDEHRYLGVSTLFQEKGCILDRHPGVYGASIPSVARDAVFRRNMPTNAVGCCLSHIGVWEKVAKTDKSHLVIEDDGLPSFDFSFEEVMKLLPVDFDVCFVNDRAYESWFDTANPKLGLAPLARSFEQLDPDIPAIGADGYILSPKGAAILLDMIRETGIIGNLDWQLYSLGLMGLEFDESRRAGALVAGLSSIMEERHKLNAYVSTIPLVSHTPMGFTARYHFS